MAKKTDTSEITATPANLNAIAKNSKSKSKSKGGSQTAKAASKSPGGNRGKIMAVESVASESSNTTSSTTSIPAGITTINILNTIGSGDAAAPGASAVITLKGSDSDTSKHLLMAILVAVMQQLHRMLVMVVIEIRLARHDI